MARTALISPDNSHRPANTGDGTEFGDNMKTVIDAVNTMTTELYNGTGQAPAGVSPAAGSLSAKLCHTGGMPPRVSTDGTDTTPATTETYIAEVFIPANMTVTGVSLFNGSAAAGNITVSLADSTGAPIATAKSASTAQAGTDAYQRIPFAAAYAAKGPATYFVLVQFSSASARFNSHVFGDFGASKKTGETYGTFTAVTPPTTFTTAQGPIASLY